jgi:hypothetical protein
MFTNKMSSLNDGATKKGTQESFCNESKDIHNTRHKLFVFQTRSSENVPLIEESKLGNSFSKMCNAIEKKID